jgi:nitrogen fixation/metabolism regulation signal transduction histidine kinase
VKDKMSIHKKSFREAIFNLIKNAEEHALTESSSDLILNFDIKEKDGNIIIDYTNNGKRFPENMTEEDFLTYGKKGRNSSGQGLGGAWIGKVIEAHKGEFKIIRDDHPLHFKIVLKRREYE